MLANPSDLSFGHPANAVITTGWYCDKYVQPCTHKCFQILSETAVCAVPLVLNSSLDI